MADQAAAPAAATPQVVAKARGLGWVPKEEFRGDESRWVDADTFVKRGEEIMPILKQNNHRLENEVSDLSTQLAAAQVAIKESQTAMADLIKLQTESTLQAVKDTKKQLRSQLRAAREAENFAAIEEIEEQLDEVADTQRKIEAKVEKPAPTPAPAPAANTPKVDPEFTAWMRDNPWFGKDKRKTALMIVEGEELRADPTNRGLVGRPFYDAAAEAAERLVNPKATHSKVETGTGSGTPSTDKGGNAVKTYADLPADAKKACDDWEKKLVGSNKAFKDKAAWQKHYVEQYFINE